MTEAVIDWAMQAAAGHPELLALQTQDKPPGAILLPVAKGGRCGLAVVLKRGRVSLQWQSQILAMRDNGFSVWVCKGPDEAIDAICRYLGIERRTQE